MAYNFEEQDQIEGLKSFWNRYGNLILTVVTVVALAIAGYRLWGWYQQNQAVAAGNAYAALQQGAADKDLARVKVAAQSLHDSHSGTIFAPMGALVAAKAYFDADDKDAAAASLQWVLDNAATSEFAPVARLRLAGVMLDQQKAEAGLALLDAVPLPQAFAALADDRRGDLLAALGRKDDAVAAWDKALEALGQNASLGRSVQLKRDALKAGS